MTARSRLVTSITLTLLLHVCFFFYVGQSAATVPSNRTSGEVQFNLLAMVTPQEIADKNRMQPPPKKKLSAKQSVINEQVKLIKKIKEAQPEKPALEKEALLKPTKSLTVNKNKREKKNNVAVVKSPIRKQRPVNKVKPPSVVKQRDKITLQEARYKSLPPAPNYPRRARVRGQQGTALIHARLNAGGEVIKTRLAKSSGFTLLDKAAMKAVYQWDFLPGSTEQNNSQVWVEIPVQFILNPSKVS